METNWKETLRTLWEKEKWYWISAVVIGVVFSLVFGAHWTKGYSEMIQNGIAAKVVRFHVLANSDSEADQKLKLAVRDKVLQEYGDLLTECESKEETLLALEKAQQKICETAAEEVAEKGYDYPVRVSIVREEFPFKKYDELIFPAGVYDALRIEIGAAEGQNWWCVLYPQMCFVDAAWGYSTEESHRKLENTLTEEEFLIVSALEQEELTPKIKLKILEFWQ
ncbi:stage II sporulation protein R [Anaerotignum sp.]